MAPGSCQSRTRRHARIPLSGSSGPSPRGLLCLSMTHAGLTDGTVCRKFPLDHEAIPPTVQEETTSGSERRLQSAYRSRIPLLEQGVGLQIPRPSIKSRLWLGAMTGQWSVVRQPDIQRQVDFDKPTTQPSVLNHLPSSRNSLCCRERLRGVHKQPWRDTRWLPSSPKANALRPCEEEGSQPQRQHIITDIVAFGRVGNT